MIRRATVADADALGQTHVQAWHEAYPGIVPAEVLAALDPAERAAMWRRNIPAGSLVHVATHADTILGFACGGPQREPALFPDHQGEIYAVYVLRAGQRQGLGRALLAAVTADLRAQGWNAATLWVLNGNAPAFAFYRALGGHQGASRTFTDRQWRGEDTAFLWDDLAPLLATQP